MSSEWVQFRDSMVKSLQFETVTEDIKREFVNWLLTHLLPIAKESADKFIKQVREQAANESGWCKFRDLIVLPAIITGVLYIVQKALESVQE